RDRQRPLRPGSRHHRLGDDGRKCLPRLEVRGLVERQRHARRRCHRPAVAQGPRQMNDAAAARRYDDRYFTVRDGLRLHYRDYPGDASSPPILCLPGLTRNARDFAQLAERYSPRFRVIALDFRGRGRSDYDPIPARYIPPTYAYDVIELLDQLAIPRTIFVGTSLGGLVTMGIAALAPDRIAAAILNDVGPELTPVGIDRIKSYVG